MSYTHFFNINKTKLTVSNCHSKNDNSVLYNLFLNFLSKSLPYFSITNVLYLQGKMLSLKFVYVKFKIPITAHSWNIWKIKCHKMYFRKCYNGLCYNCLKIQILLTTLTSRRDTFAYMLYLTISNDDICYIREAGTECWISCVVYSIQWMCGFNEKKP